MKHKSEAFRLRPGADFVVNHFSDYGGNSKTPASGGSRRRRLVFDAHGTMLRIAMVKGVVPARYTVPGWQAPDIVAAAKSLLEAGVRFERYAGMEQDEFGIWRSSSGAQVAWFKDPLGIRSASRNIDFNPA